MEANTFIGAQAVHYARMLRWSGGINSRVGHTVNDLSNVLRIACLDITSSCTPTVAMGTILVLPPLQLLLWSEATLGAYRTKYSGCNAFSGKNSSIFTLKNGHTGPKGGQDRACLQLHEVVPCGYLQS